MKDKSLLLMLEEVWKKLNRALQVNPAGGVFLVKEAYFGLELIIRMLQSDEDSE